MVFAINTEERMAPECRKDKSKAAIWKETIAQMESSLIKMSEEDKAAYEQKIRQKMQAGKKLTSEEMNYLRVNQPELYQSAMRVETARKALRIKLKNCKSKEEVQNVISVQTEVLKAMEGDTDREYLAAMVEHEVETFRKSSAYARLPERIEDGKKKNTPISEREIWKEEEGITSSNKMSVLGQMQIQCEMISQMSKAFVA